MKACCCRLLASIASRSINTVLVSYHTFYPQHVSHSNNTNKRTQRLATQNARGLTRLNSSLSVRHPSQNAQGIGKAIVEELASLGAKVLTCSRTEEDVTACVQVRYRYSCFVCLLLV